MSKKKKNISTSPSTDKEYNDFIKNLKLIALGLGSSSSKLERGNLIRLRDKKDAELRKITAVYEVSSSSDDHFDLEGKFNFSCADRQGGESPLVIECRIDAHFHGKRPVNKEFAKRFAESEFRFVVWPFFRQFVFDMTARMAIPPVAIPLSDDK
jgi:hypothetical protein